MGHGGKRKGSGRKPGATQPEIKKAREAIAKFCDINSDKIQTWFDEVAAENPEKALDILYKYMEFHVPKLARREIKAESRIVDKHGEDIIQRDLDILKNTGLLEDTFILNENTKH